MKVVVVGFHNRSCMEGEQYILRVLGCVWLWKHEYCKKYAGGISSVD